MWRDIDNELVSHVDVVLDGHAFKSSETSEKNEMVIFFAACSV